MNRCPCNKCICVAMCRLKTYPSLINSCSLLLSYLENPFSLSLIDRSNGRLKLIQKSLDPKTWTLFYDEFGRAMVDSYTGYKQCHFYY